MIFTSRFAPSPTGPLHLGHAYSALLNARMAQAAGGRFLLRIDDIDQSRARAAWEAQIYEDLAWLGLSWALPVRRQSEHSAAYRAAINLLSASGLTYACRCSRRDIREAAGAPHAESAHGPGGLVYPGTCRGRSMDAAGPGEAIRLDVAKAAARIGHWPWMVETGEAAGRRRLQAEAVIERIGDIVLVPPGMAASYFLSVVVDDAAQGVTTVIRGQDLAPSTEIYAFLATLLGVPVPEFHHHRLITDADGKRLAKRDDARAIATYRDEGLSPEDVRRLVGF